MPDRSPAEIRASIEQTHQKFTQSLQVLHGEVVEVVDWRGQIRKHRDQIMLGAGAGGFLFGGGIAATVGLLFRRRRSE